MLCAAKLLVAVLVFGVFTALAQIREGIAASKPIPGSSIELNSQPSSSPQNAPKRPVVIEAILKMNEAGVSTEVIKTYIETYPRYCAVKAEDLIELKKHSITDALTVTLLKRNAELQAARTKRALGDAPYGSSLPALKSDSYDFFEHFYLYPRALASVNERLGMYPGYFNNRDLPYWSSPPIARRGY